MSTSCPTDDELFALAHGQLAAEESARLKSHVVGCVSCGAAMAEAARGLAGSQAGTVTEPKIVSAETLMPGAQLGRYVIGELLGKGSMGAVYAAQDPELHRRVAIKVLRPDSRVNIGRQELQQRLLREAQAMARLSHPSVVAVHDVGTFGDQVFIAMDLVEGSTLRRWLAADKRGWREILDRYLAAGRGLAAAHAAGLVHRDFKPDNVLVGSDGRTLVTDFGLARSARPESAQSPEVPPASPAPPGVPSSTPGPLTPPTLTPLDGMPGTPAYMAPEQLRGGGADARTDLFAFCTSLYEGVAGTAPYAGRDLADLRARAESGRIESPRRAVPKWLLRELARGLRPDPTQRHKSMEALLATLERGAARRQLWTYALFAAGIGALAFLAADRAGLLVALRRAMPQERAVARSIARAQSEAREHGRLAGAQAFAAAEAAAPGNPRLLLGLGELQLELGASGQANETFARAELRQEALTASERTKLAILRAQTLRETDKAVQLAERFYQESPADLERAFLYSQQLSLANRFADELLLLDKLRRLPPPDGQDPRIDLNEAGAVQGDYPRAVAAARRALAAFTARGDKVNMSRARYREAIALRRQGAGSASVRGLFEEAIALARAAGDPADVYAPEQMRASMQAGEGDLAGARATIEDALAILAQIGNVPGEGSALITLSGVLRRQRDLPAAIDRVTAAQTIFLELGDRSRVSMSQTMLGDLRDELGDLAGAAGALEKAVAFQRQAKDPIMLLDALTGLAHVRLEQGELAEARKLVDELKANSAGATKRSRVSVSWMDGGVALAEGSYAAAEAAAQAGVKLAAEAGFVDEEAEENAQLARALLEEGRLQEARLAVSRGQALLAKTTSGVARGEIAVADGLLLAREDPRHLERAETALSAALADAMRVGVAADQWEARLALAETQTRMKNRGGRVSLEQLEQQARAQGFGLYARSAEAALAR